MSNFLRTLSVFFQNQEWASRAVGTGAFLTLRKCFVVVFEVTKTEFVRTPTIEIELNSQIYLASTSELIEKDWIMLELPQ